jgi:hypothetical protein
MIRVIPLGQPAIGGMHVIGCCIRRNTENSEVAFCHKNRSFLNRSFFQHGGQLLPFVGWYSLTDTCTAHGFEDGPFILSTYPLGYGLVLN